MLWKLFLILHTCQILYHNFWRITQKSKTEKSESHCRLNANSNKCQDMVELKSKVGRS